jgi:Papain-like cysteine protease AvrRpt2
MFVKTLFKFNLSIKVCIVLLLAICGISCAQSDTPEISEPKVNSVSFSANTTNSPLTFIDYRVPNTVFPIIQTKKMDCWAACSAMLVSWKEKKMVNTKELVGRLSSTFGILYDTDAGLLPADQSILLKELKFRQENPQNYTVQGWLSLLTNNGVLWVTSATWTGKKWAVHARIVVGIRGNGDPSETNLTIIDPGIGLETNESISDFAKKMEDLAIPRPWRSGGNR